MQLTSTITSYNPLWPYCFRREVSKVAPIFDASLVEIHHVGSTAIPGISAKPEIDILAVIKEPIDVEVWTNELARLGYRRGGDLSPGHLFYKRDVEGVRTHKIHVCTEGHPQIQAMLQFRNHLRDHADTRKRYEALKLKLQAENIHGISEYLEGKASFVAEVLSSLGTR